MSPRDRLLVEAFLNHSFNGTLSDKTEAILDKYMQSRVMLESAEDSEAFDHWSIQPAISWNQ